MKLSPIQGAIETVRLLLSNSLKMKSSQEENITIPPFISPLPPQYQAPPNLFPNGQDTFLPPLDSNGFSILPPFNPIGPYRPPVGGQNQNDVPDDIRELLG